MYLIIKGCNSRTIRWKRGLEQGMWGWMWSLSPLDLPFSEDFCVFVVVQSLGRVQLFVTPCTAARQVSLSITNSQSLLNSCPSSRWCHPIISSSVIPFSRLQYFPASGSFPVSSLHQVAKVLEFQLQHQSFQWTPRTDFLYDWLVGSPFISKDSQESSPAPQFESINSSALSLSQSNSHIRTWLLEKP